MRAEKARQRVEAQKRFEEEKRKAEEAIKTAEEEEKGCNAKIPLLPSSRSRSRFLSFLSLQNRSRFKWAAGVGRKSGLKTVYIGRVLDWQKVLHYFSGHQQVRDLLQKLVDADVRLNKTQCTIPGVWR